MSTMLEQMFTLGKLNHYAYECTRQSRWKETTHRYLSNLLINNITLRSDVLEGRYRVSPTTNFTINERGKTRHIEAPAIRDRIVQKALVRDILAPRLTRCLIYDNYASLPHRGTSFARKRFDIQLQRFMRLHGTDGYILLIDIRKYFESIDHSVLKRMIEPHFRDCPDDVRQLIEYIIDTSSKTGKGLNLGSEAPQIFAIFYLNMLDHYIKTVRGIRYYGRYMDDIFLIAQTKHELTSLLTDIERVLHGILLDINYKKTHITKLTHGFTYLQIKYSVTPAGSIVKRPAHSKTVRERRRLKAFKRMTDAERMAMSDVCDCYQSWEGSFSKDHNAYHKTLTSLDALYNRLYPDKAEKPLLSRKTLLKSIYKGANDMKHIINC